MNQKGKTKNQMRKQKNSINVVDVNAITLRILNANDLD
jgi:hypothetical protein